MNPLPKITLVPLQHREKEVVCLRFGYEPALHSYIKLELKDRLWSNTHKSWYVPNKAGLAGELVSFFKNKANLDYSLLNKTVAVEPVQARRPHIEAPQLSAGHLERAEEFRRWMRSRRY